MISDRDTTYFTVMTDPSFRVNLNDTYSGVLEEDWTCGDNGEPSVLKFVLDIIGEARVAGNYKEVVLTNLNTDQKNIIYALSSSLKMSGYNQIELNGDIIIPI
jgi:hypothetical protein